MLSTNYTSTDPSNNFVGSLAFAYNSNDLYAVGFDFTQNNLGSVLGFPSAQGSSTRFSGTLFTDPSLVRPIGIVAAVPESSTIAGITLALAGLGLRRKQKAEEKREKTKGRE